MPIEFRCSHCGKLLRTADGTAGRQAQCPECGTIGTVPGGPTPASPTPPPSAGANPFAAAAEPSAGPTDYPYPSSYAAGTVASAAPKATVALVLSIIGMVTWCCPLIGFPINILALVFGILALRDRANATPIVAIVLSSIGILLCLSNAAMGVWMTMRGQNVLFP
jgi:hypothetical protein